MLHTTFHKEKLEFTSVRRNRPPFWRLWRHNNKPQSRDTLGSEMHRCDISHIQKYTFSIMVVLYKYFLFVVFVSYLLNVSSKKYNPVNTYFHRVHPNGTVVDQHNPITRLKFNFQSLQHSEHINPEVFLKASPSIVANGGNVTLSWAGVKSPNAGDAVVFYCPADAKPSHYLDYYHVTSSPTWEQGFGDFQLLKVFNMRYRH